MATRKVCGGMVHPGNGGPGGGNKKLPENANNNFSTASENSNESNESNENNLIKKFSRLGKRSTIKGDIKKSRKLVNQYELRRAQKMLKSNPLSASSAFGQSILRLRNSHNTGSSALHPRRLRRAKSLAKKLQSLKKRNKK